MHQPDHTPVAILALALVVLALAGSLLWLHLTGPSDGTRLPVGARTWQHAGVRVTSLADWPGGLRDGDLVVAVEGKSMAAWAHGLLTPGSPHPHWQVGQTVRYRVLRQGHPLDLAITLRRYPLADLLAQVWGRLCVALVGLAVAAFVFATRPHERTAQALFLGACAVVAAVVWLLGSQVGDLLDGLGFWLSRATISGAYALVWVAGLRFWLGFRSVRALLAPRRWAAPALYLAPLVLYAVLVLRPSAPDVLAWIGRWDQTLYVLSAAYFLTMAVAMVGGYLYTPDPAVRRTVRAVINAARVAALGVLCGPVAVLVLGKGLLDANVLALLFLPLPLALAVTIWCSPPVVATAPERGTLTEGQLRARAVELHPLYPLFGVAPVLNRTLVYGALTAWVVGLYALVVGLLGALVAARASLLVSLLATGLVAVAFQPLRERLQRAVDQLMYGERQDPYAVLSRLESRLEATPALGAVLPAIVETVAQTLKLPHAAIAVWEGATEAIAASYGPSRETSLAVPLVCQGETMGELRLAPRVPGEPFGEADRRLVAAIGVHAGIALYAVRLAADLQRARERLVAAREEERRRLRRDLHDGLGPTLAGLTLQLDAARTFLAGEPRGAALLLEMREQAQAALQDIRRLVDGLRPPALDELGLVCALREHVATYEHGETTVLVEAPESLPLLPAAVEVAAYRIALEAVTNAVRHAQARTCRVRLLTDGDFSLEIVDDGCGFAPEHREGLGLRSMRERAAELGGTCVIDGQPGRGTAVCVRLPLPKE
jgi:signal transduction histidine kinase